MIKSELAKRLNNIHQYMNQKDANRIVEIIFENIKNALLDRRRVELRGFGTFSVHERKPRIGRNPRTGESVNVPSKEVPFFKAGRQLIDYINSSPSDQ